MYKYNEEKTPEAYEFFDIPRSEKPIPSLSSIISKPNLTLIRSLFYICDIPKAKPSPA